MIYKKQYVYKNDDALLEILVRLHLVFKKIYIQEKVLQIFLYFCKYGIQESTLKLLLTDKVVSTRQTINNAKTVLKKVGLIRKNIKWEVSEPLNDISLDSLNVLVLCTKIQ